MKRYKIKFKESSWSRIIQHIESGEYSFAVISAYIRELPRKVNLKRHEDLKRDIRSLGYGCIEQKSGYTYEDEENRVIEEQSFFVPLIKRDESLILCAKYQQYSILFKDNTGFYEILGNGKVNIKFKTKRNKNGQITFDPKILKIAYSQLKKGSDHQRKQKFAYVVKECVWIEEYRIPTRYEGYKEGKIPKARYIEIL